MVTDLLRGIAIVTGVFVIGFAISKVFEWMDQVVPGWLGWTFAVIGCAIGIILGAYLWWESIMTRVRRREPPKPVPGEKRFLCFERDDRMMDEILRKRKQAEIPDQRV